MENRSFLVDTSNLKDVNDVLADDSGSWVNNGQHRFHYELDEGGIYRRVGRRASFATPQHNRLQHIDGSSKAVICQPQW